MSRNLPREYTASKIRRDATAVITVSFFAALGVISLAIQKFLKTFTPDGIGWVIPVEPQSVTAQGLTLYTQAGPVPRSEITGTVTSLHITVSDVTMLSTICLGAAIAIAGLAGLTVIACTAQLAWQFLRGQFFTATSSFAVRVLIWAFVLGGSASYITWFFGAKGVGTAAGSLASDAAGPEWWSLYAVIMFVVISIGLLDIALRRAVRMQRDQEGLV